VWGLLAVIVTVAVGVIAVRRASVPDLSTDFTVYWVAGREAWNGGQALYTVSDQRGLHYIYPPFFAVLILPIALLPVAAAAAVWYVISVALLLIGLRSVIRLVAPDGKPATVHLLWAPLLISADPILGTLTRGQLGILMFACSVGALSLHRRKQSFAAGFIVAFATVIKMYTGLLGIYFLVRRDWRAVWGAVTGAFLCGMAVPALALGPRQTLVAWREWIDAVIAPFFRSGGTDTPLYRELHNLEFARNQSLVATLTHLSDLFTGAQSAVEPHWVRVTMSVVTVLALLALILVWRRKEGDSRYRPIFSWALAVMWGMLLVPVAWTHYFVMLILPLTAIVGYLLREPHDAAWRTLRATFGATVVLASLYTLTSILQGPLTWLGMRSVVMVPRSVGLYCFASLILSAGLLFTLIRESSGARPAKAHREGAPGS
jgi:alpha-1,2-mannosyltransferase